MNYNLEISDTGIGISEQNLKKLFLDFGKLEDHQGINNQGTGLGLSICKKIIEKMGGEVGVTSILDRGTTFKVAMRSSATIDRS